MDGRPRVLVVDDSPLSAGLLCDLAALAGGEALWAKTAAEALAEGEAFALAIVDLRLPDGDGADLARRLKGRCPAPVIACSATPPGELLPGAWDDQPFDGWIGKPFESARVLARLREILGNEKSA